MPRWPASRRPATATTRSSWARATTALVTAALFARAGRSVLVLERRGVVGGAAATEEIFPGCRVSVAAQDAGLFRPGIVSALGLGSARPRVGPPARARDLADRRRQSPHTLARSRQDSRRDRASQPGRRGSLPRMGRLPADDGTRAPDRPRPPGSRPARNDHPGAAPSPSAPPSGGQARQAPHRRAAARPSAPGPRSPRRLVPLGRPQGDARHHRPAGSQPRPERDGWRLPHALSRCRNRPARLPLHGVRKGRAPARSPRRWPPRRKHAAPKSAPAPK